MGNKTGKFNVPPADKVNKDGQVINEGDHNDEPNCVEANGDQSNPESNGLEKCETKEAEAKKKSIVSWFKKVSIRKEKKPKVPKENGVREEAEAHKENGVKEEADEIVKDNTGNGDVISEKVEPQETPEVHVEEQETSPEVENKEEPLVNGHENGTENAEHENNEQ